MTDSENVPDHIHISSTKTERPLIPHPTADSTRNGPPAPTAERRAETIADDRNRLGVTIVHDSRRSDGAAATIGDNRRRRGRRSSVLEGPGRCRAGEGPIAIASSLQRRGRRAGLGREPARLEPPATIFSGCEGAALGALSYSQRSAVCSVFPSCRPRAISLPLLLRTLTPAL